MDILTPFGQAYCTKSSFPKILDHCFGPAGCPNGLSLPDSWYNHCCPAEEVDSAQWAAREVSGQKTYCYLHHLNTNGFHVAAVGQVGVLETSFETLLCKVGTVMMFHDLTHMMK